jgi:hypothetical protein
VAGFELSPGGLFWVSRDKLALYRGVHAWRHFILLLLPIGDGDYDRLSFSFRHGISDVWRGIREIPQFIMDIWKIILGKKNL